MRHVLIWLAAVVVIGGHWGFGAEVDVASKVRGGHPRILWDDATAGRVKDAIANDAWVRRRYAEQVKVADGLLKAPVSRYVLPDGVRLLPVSRAVLERVATLALVYRVSGDKKYLDRCWAELEAVSKFGDWHPPHFLDVAEMTAAVAIGYDWLYADLSDERRQLLREAIVDKGLRPAVEVYDHRYNWWPSEVHNWNVVCNGGVSMGALAVAGEVGEEEGKVVGRVLSEAVKSVPRCLHEFEPDGAWPEGPAYWGYATLYESMYLDSLRTACGEEFGLADGKGAAEAGWFPVYLNGATGRAFNFADAHESASPEAGCQLFWMARRFGEPRYAQYQVEAGSGRVRALDVVWGAGAAREPWQTIPTDRYFRKVEIATMRDRWGDKDAWFVGFKAGSNAVNHSHLDVGSYVMEAKGERWVVDLGPEDYNLPGYWDKKGGRWQYYRLRAEGHNTIVVNPGKGPDQVPTGGGTITRFEPEEKGVALEADLTGAYAGVEKVVRKIEFVRGSSVTVRDRVVLKEPGVVWSFLHTRAKAEVSDGGRVVTLSEQGKSVKVELIGAEGAKWTVGEAKEMASSPHPAKQSANPGVTSLGVKVEGKDVEVGYRVE